MTELIAQGTEPTQYWRKTLRIDERFVLGREAGLWSVPWDEHISRQHAELCWSGTRLQVARLGSARNPIFKAGSEAQQFDLAPGEHFVIGRTSFTVHQDRAAAADDSAPAIEEKTFSTQYLRGLRFHNADHRIEVLTRLPDLISGAADEQELFARLVDMLLAGMPRAGTVALVMLEPQRTEGSSVRVLHWDRRVGTGGEFHASQRLVTAAVQSGHSVVHVWGNQSAAAVDLRYTMAEDIDWAFCTPLRGNTCARWAVYVGGTFSALSYHGLLGQSDPQNSTTDPSDLREDVKFAELVASTVSSLRDVQMLQRRQSTLSQFFAPSVFEAMATEKPDVVLAPRETEVTVLFCDLRGFSRQTEQSAGDLMGLLQRVSKALGVMTHHILDQGGVFGDFQGDAAMGFWGWPFDQPDKVQRACLAALAIRQEFESAARRPGHPLADFRMGIGLATGRAVAGRIGTTDQVKVTVFGPVANRASRLEGMTKILHTPILMDAKTAEAVRREVPDSLVRLRRLAVVRPYGMETPVEVNELLPPAGEYLELSDDDLHVYEEALTAFEQGRWSESLELLYRVPAKDRVKDFLTIHIVEHGRTPPPNFDGVIPLVSK